MIEVEAKISRLSLTFLGQPIEFGDQVLYFQSKSVLEVFRTLIAQGRPDMWIVGVLVLMFSIVFPVLKIFTSVFYMYKPSLLRQNRVARFLALESSKWSMADVMALAIFMAFVAFNGLIANTMGALKGTGAELALPTDSSKMLPGYYLFLGFCYSKPVSLEEAGTRHPDFAGHRTNLTDLLRRTDAGASRVLDIGAGCPAVMPIQRRGAAPNSRSSASCSSILM